MGTVAAGVAKAYADYVLVSGHSTAARAPSPLTSIKHAGSPGSSGVAETQQVLVRNGLRGRVRLRTDGGLRPRARRGHRRAAGRRGVRLRHRQPGGDRLRHGAPVPPEHLPDGHRHPARRPARQVQRHARAGHRLLRPPGRRDPRAAGQPRLALASTKRSGGSTCCARRASCNGVDLSAVLADPDPSWTRAAPLHPAAQRPTRRPRAARRGACCATPRPRWPTGRASRPRA